MDARGLRRNPKFHREGILQILTTWIPWISKNKQARVCLLTSSTHSLCHLEVAIEPIRVAWPTANWARPCFRQVYHARRSLCAPPRPTVIYRLGMWDFPRARCCFKKNNNNKYFLKCIVCIKKFNFYQLFRI